MVTAFERLVTRIDSSPGAVDAPAGPLCEAAAEVQRPRRLTIFQVHQKTSLSTGSVQQMMQAARGLASRGHEVVTVTRPAQALEMATASAGLTHVTLPFRHYLDLRTVTGLRRLIGRWEPDVIHVHKGLAHWLVLAALMGNRSTALIVNRGVTFPLTRWNRAKYRTPRVDRIVTVCEAVREVIATSGGVDRQRIDVVYAGTDVVRFDRNHAEPARIRRELGIPLDAFVILQAGTRAWKGWRDVVDAFVTLRTRVPGARLLMVGHDSDTTLRQVREHVRARELDHDVHVLGYRSDLEHLMAAADVTVDASWDGTGITGTIRESMAIGTAVVATDCGGNRELLSSSDLGWLIPPRDHEALVGALSEVASSAERRASVAANAQRLVRERLSVDRRIDRLEAIYDECVAARGPAAVAHPRRRQAGLTG